MCSKVLRQPRKGVSGGARSASCAPARPGRRRHRVLGVALQRMLGLWLLDSGHSPKWGSQELEKGQVGWAGAWGSALLGSNGLS